VARVYAGTPADKWKLKPGDTILSVDGVKPISAAWLVHHLAAQRPGDRIPIEVLHLETRTIYRMKLSARYPDE
jgi:S1-C subfamily serine protease